MLPMTLARGLACLALCAGAARAVPLQQAAADARAPVPSTVYEPAVSYHTEPPPTGTPDRNWLASNAAVTRRTGMRMAMDGHAAATGHDAMAGGEAHAGHDAGAHPVQPARQCGAGGCACCAHGHDKQRAAPPAAAHQHGEIP